MVNVLFPGNGVGVLLQPVTLHYIIDTLLHSSVFCEKLYYSMRTLHTDRFFENKRKNGRTEKNSLSNLQMPITVWKAGLEKQARSLRVMPLGRPSFRGLCWGMKSSRASAWMPYFSRVQVVRSSHRCFCSHHSAWSDQSRLISAQNTKHLSAGHPVAAGTDVSAL